MNYDNGYYSFIPRWLVLGTYDDDDDDDSLLLVDRQVGGTRLLVTLIDC